MAAKACTVFSVLIGLFYYIVGRREFRFEAQHAWVQQRTRRSACGSLASFGLVIKGTIKGVRFICTLPADVDN
jgi:hypothetical protein